MSCGDLVLSCAEPPCNSAAFPFHPKSLAPSVSGNRVVSSDPSSTPISMNLFDVVPILEKISAIAASSYDCEVCARCTCHESRVMFAKLALQQVVLEIDCLEFLREPSVDPNALDMLRVAVAGDQFTREFGDFFALADVPSGAPPSPIAGSGERSYATPKLFSEKTLRRITTKPDFVETRTRYVSSDVAACGCIFIRRQPALHLRSASRVPWSAGGCRIAAPSPRHDSPAARSGYA